MGIRFTFHVADPNPKYFKTTFCIPENDIIIKVVMSPSSENKAKMNHLRLYKRIGGDDFS